MIIGGRGGNDLILILHISGGSSSWTIASTKVDMGWFVLLERPLVSEDITLQALPEQDSKLSYSALHVW